MKQTNKLRCGLMMWLTMMAGLMLCLASGCGTVRGIGQDLQRMAEWSQHKLDNGFDHGDDIKFTFGESD